MLLGTVLDGDTDDEMEEVRWVDDRQHGQHLGAKQQPSASSQRPSGGMQPGRMEIWGSSSTGSSGAS